MSKRTRPRNLAALERRRRRHARRSAVGVIERWQRVTRAAWVRIMSPVESAHFDNLESLGSAIRRRLTRPELDYGYDMGFLMSQVVVYPTSWRKLPDDPEWLKLEYRMTSPTQVEFRVTPHPVAPFIEVSIGFSEPGAPLVHARAVKDAATCHTCATMDGLPIERADSVPWASCTSENGCRCVAEP